MRKKSLSLALALVLALSLAVPSLAASTSVTMIRTNYTGPFTPDVGEGFSWTEFSEGLAPVQKNGKYGYIDSNGKVVIPLQYDWCDKFSEDLGQVWKNEKLGYIDRTGKMVLSLQDYSGASSFSEGLAAVRGSNEDGKCGYIDRTGKLVIPLQYDDADDFSEGLAAVTEEKISWKSGYIDCTGKVVIPLQYDEAHPFSEGLAVVRKGEKYGYIDRTGKVVIPLQYHWCEPFSDGMAAVGMDDYNYKYIDRTGKEVTSQEYSFFDGLAAVEKNEKWGYIDRDGKVVIPLQYDYVYDFSEGLAVVYKDEKKSFIDTAGRFVATIPSDVFGEIMFSDGVAVTTDDDDHIVIFKKKTMNQPSTSVIPSFLDVSVGAYYAAPVQWAVEKGITAGTSATTFSPDNTCTTAQILTFLWRAKGSPAPTKSDSSVPGGQYYSDAANWALERGLTDRFRADAPATRLATVTYLWKLAGSPAVTSGTSFTDVTENTQAVAWAVKQGITKGTSDTTFSPSTTCTRGQIVTFLHRDLAE